MARGSTKSPEAFRTISEAAEALDLPQHVLRFWETRFSQIKPMKRSGGRRYYRPNDIALLRGIRHLLYDEGYTIKGVQRILREQGVAFVSTQGEDGGQGATADAAPEPRSAAPEPQSRPDPQPRQATVQPTVPESAEPMPGQARAIQPAPMPAAPVQAPPVQPSPVQATPVQTAPASRQPVAAEPERRGRLSHADVNALATALRDLIECKIILDDARPGQRDKAAPQHGLRSAGSG